MDTFLVDILLPGAFIIIVLILGLQAWTDSMRIRRDHRYPQRVVLLEALRYEYACLAQKNPAQFEALEAPASLALKVDEILQHAQREAYPLFEYEVRAAICDGLVTPRTISEEKLRALFIRLTGALWILREGRTRTPVGPRAQPAIR